MSIPQDKLRVALQSRELNSITRALREFSEKLGYQLKPPYTEVLHLEAEEEGNRFAIQFSANLYLHYSKIPTGNEGLVFTLGFSGEAYSDSPNPPVDELFGAGVADSLSVCAYGSKWSGETIATPDLFAKNLEVASPTLMRISMDELLKRI